jgi:hypothetical protein
MRRVGVTMLAGLINHEYQPDCWVAEVRQTLGHGDPPAPLSSSQCLIHCDGSWVLDLTLSATAAGAGIP